MITSLDLSFLVSATYTGRGSVRMFDRRVDNWGIAYLFNLIWNDGLRSSAQINPENKNLKISYLYFSKMSNPY